MSSSINAANRVVATINVFKWIIVITLALAGVIVALAVEFATTLPRIVEAGALVAGVLAAMITWVTFGWRQHTLGMLTIIAQPPVRIVNMVGGGAGTPTRNGEPGSVTFTNRTYEPEPDVADSNEPVSPPNVVRGDGAGGYYYGNSHHDARNGGSAGTAGTDRDFDEGTPVGNSLGYEPGR